MSCNATAIVPSLGHYHAPWTILLTALSSVLPHPQILLHLSLQQPFFAVRVTSKLIIHIMVNCYKVTITKPH